MSINLRKGGSINLTKEMTRLNKVMIGLGWEKTTMNIDLDASVFVLGSSRIGAFFSFLTSMTLPKEWLKMPMLLM